MTKRNLITKVDSQEFREFLVEAKNNSWANENMGKIQLPNGSKQIKFGKNDLIYIDTYHAHPEKFIGSEKVWFGERQIWQMNYSGRLLPSASILEIDPKTIYSFLKKALMKVNSFAPFRGPETFEENKWLYLNDIKRNNIIDFEGEESIRFKRDKVYVGNYQGMGF